MFSGAGGVLHNRGAGSSSELDTGTSDKATGAPSSLQGALELRLSITFIHRPFLRVVILVFIF